MDIQSFILGMGAVLLIATAISGVVAVVKVYKLKKHVTWTENNRQSEMQNVYNELDRIKKSIESRADKLESKFLKELENIKNH